MFERRRERWKARALAAERALRQSAELLLLSRRWQREGRTRDADDAEVAALQWARGALGRVEPYRPVRARIGGAAGQERP